MATIKTRQRKDGSLAYLSEVRIKRDVVEEMLPYIESAVANGVPLGRITRHMLGLYAGQPGARAWRHYITENANRSGAGPEVLVNALNAMPMAA